MKLSRAALALFFSSAGVLHFVKPRGYEAIVPPGVPKKEAVQISGVAEILGGLAPLHPRGRPLGPARPADGGLPRQRPHGGQPRAGAGPREVEDPQLGALGAA